MNAQRHRTSRATVSTPVMARCVNAMAAGAAIGVGITCPLQKGQCAPQPSPENEIRTNAPHKMTGMLNANTAHANRAKFLCAELLVSNMTHSASAHAAALL